MVFRKYQFSLFIFVLIAYDLHIVISSDAFRKFLFDMELTKQQLEVTTEQLREGTEELTTARNLNTELNQDIHNLTKANENLVYKMNKLKGTIFLVTMSHDELLRTSNWPPRPQAGQDRSQMGPREAQIGPTRLYRQRPLNLNCLS